MRLRWNEKINNQKMIRLVLISLFFIVCFVSFGVHAEKIQAVHFKKADEKAFVFLEFTGSSDFKAIINHGRDQDNLSIFMKEKGIGDVTLAEVIDPFVSVFFKNENNYSKIILPLVDQRRVIASAFVLEGDPNRLVVELIKQSDESSQNNLNHTRFHGNLLISKKEIDRITALRKPLIMIDAGHGGYDSGAVSRSGILEKDITLSIAKTLYNLLNQTGRYRVAMTRETDQFIPLYDRVAMVQDSQVDFFISIHADSVRDNVTQGASIYTLSEIASDAETAKLAERENMMNHIPTAGRQEIGDIQSMLLKMVTSKTMGSSDKFATQILRSLRKNTIPLLKNPHRQANFVVLRAMDVPSVLFETGFISNDEQAKTLLKPSYQKKLANALLNAMDQYFGF